MSCRALAAANAFLVVIASGAFAGGWELLDGPFGARVSDLVEAQNGDLLLACDEGVYRFEPGEGWWRPTGLVGVTTKTLFVATDGVVWAGGFGIWRSLDDGETWQDASEGLGAVGTLVHHFAERGGTVLAATEGGLIARDHDSDRWRLVFPETAHQLADLGSTRAVAVTPDGTILIGIGRYVLRSNDAGEGWHDSLTLNSLVTAIATGPEGLVLVGAADPGVAMRGAEPAEVYLSTDDGVSYNRADGYGGDQPLPVNDVGEAVITGDSILFVGGFRESGWNGSKGGGLWQSTDCGETWEGILGAVASRLNVRTVAFTTGGTLWLGTDMGPYRSLSAGQGIGVERVSGGLSIRDSRVRGLLWSSVWGLVAWADGYPMQALGLDGLHWRDFGLTNNMVRSAAVAPDGSVVAAARGGVYNLTRGAGNAAWSGDAVWEVDNVQPTMVAGDPSRPSGIVCAAGPRVMRCRIEGWWVDARFDGGLISGLVLHPSNAIFAALDSELPDHLHRVIRSVDGFQTWDTVWQPESPIRPGSLIAGRDGRLYAVLADGSFAASDLHGTDWRRRAELRPAPTAIAIDEADRLYAATSDEVLQSANGGWGWTGFGDRVVGAEITSIAAGDGSVYVGTSRGVFRGRLVNHPMTRRAGRRLGPVGSR